MKLSKQKVIKEENISIRFMQQKDISMHSHEFFEFVYVVSGSILHTLNGKTRRIDKGDYFFIDIGDEHCYSTKKYGDANIINCLFMPSFVDGSMLGVTKFPSLMSNYLIKLGNAPLECTPSGVIYRDDDGSVGKIYEKMLPEYNEKKDGYEEILRCYLIEIIILTVRKAIKSNGTAREKSLSDKAFEYIDKHYAEDISLYKLAKKLNYSVPYLSKNIKTETGENFVNHLQKVRLEHSCRLLANTDKSVYEIMCSVGYRDVKFFNLIFKKNFGATPSEYRKRLKNTL